MGITQVDIKINQTNLINGGKPKTASKPGAAGTSFDQVLAMINLLGQTPAIEGQVMNKSLLKNGSDQGGNIPAEPLMTNEGSVGLNSESLTTDKEQPDLIEISDSEQESAGLNLNMPNTISNPLVYTLVPGVFKPMSHEDSQSSVVDFQSDGLHSDLISNPADRVRLNEEKEPLDLLEVSGENIGQLQSILTVLLNQFQEVHQTQDTVDVETVKLGTREIIGQSMISSEIRNLLARGQELVDDVKKNAPVDSSELLHKVTQVLGEIQDSQKSTQEIPADAEEKIQIILNELKTAQKTGLVQEPIVLQQDDNKEPNPIQQHDAKKDQNLIQPNDKREPNPIQLDVKMDRNPIQPNQGISLDKNQVHHSVLPHLAKAATEGHRQSDVPFSPRSVDFTHTNGQPIFINHQPQVSSNELKNVNQLSNLEITEFAPEVSEWISRFAKITNGKSGSTEAKFSLFPEHLGHIEIKVTTQQGQVSAQILTDTPMAKDVLEGQLQHLKQALQQSGLHVQKLDVVQQTTVSNDINQAGLGFSQDSSQSSREQRTYTTTPDNRKEQKERSEQNEHDREITPITYGGASLTTSSRIDFTA